MEVISGGRSAWNKAYVFLMGRPAAPWRAVEDQREASCHSSRGGWEKIKLQSAGRLGNGLAANCRSFAERHGSSSGRGPAKRFLTLRIVLGKEGTHFLTRQARNTQMLPAMATVMKTHSGVLISGLSGLFPLHRDKLFRSTSSI